MLARVATRLYLLLVLLLPLRAASQSVPDTVTAIDGIEITTSVSPAEAYIGDLITYDVAIRYDSGVLLEPPPLGANLGAFDVKDYRPDVQSRLPDGRIESRSTFQLSTFTTGQYVIPPIPIVFTLKDGSRKVLVTEPAAITIQSLLLNTDDSADIKGNKAQFTYPRDLTSYYYGGAGLLLLIGALLVWLFLRKKKGITAAHDNRTPWEIARDGLAALAERSLIESGAYREYYFELTEIVKAYLGRMYQREIPEMTTEEFLGCAAEIGLRRERIDALSRFFSHADLVKFATYRPDVERVRADGAFVSDLIEQIRLDCTPTQAPGPEHQQQPPAAAGQA